jgi:monofunctional biosynthetic peptidoglycan transglycosylase
MPTRPARRGRSEADGRARGQARSAGGARAGLRGRIRFILVRVALVLLLAPPLLLLVYRFVPPPITPLMLIRLGEGEGLDKDWRPLEEIAPGLAEAVVASEDNRFCEHWGFDWPALEGEIRDLLAGGHARGASTITMQTAKNLFLWPDRSFLRKLLEAPLTPQIELLWPKRRIIEVYLNIVELGPGIYGAEAAAQHYFGKPAKALGAREAALLAAALPSPRTSSPAKPSDWLEERARTIRTRIAQLGPMLDCVRTG